MYGYQMFRFTEISSCWTCVL